MTNIKDLNIAQQGELIEQYSQLVVDSMDLESLVQYVKEDLHNHYQSLSYPELEEEIRCSFDEETLDELVDNVTQQYDANNPTFHMDQAFDKAHKEVEL